MGAANPQRIVAVSTNPAIDRVARIDGPPSGVVRASELLETAGGKAIHVACVAAELGAAAALITTAGGHSGDLLLALLAAEPVDVHSVAVAGSTRATYTLVGADGGDFAEIHEPGGDLTTAEADRLVAALGKLGAAPAIVAVCGSLPAGAPVDLHARLIAEARDLGAYTILDSSTPAAMATALAEAPDLVAPNRAEASALLGADRGEPDPPTVAAAILERGAGSVWLSLGADGSLFADADGAVRLAAPAPERIENTVGCGDALVGGFAAALVAGRDPRAAAVHGAAAAADKLARLHPGRVDRAAVEALEASIEVTELRTGATV